MSHSPSRAAEPSSNLTAEAAVGFVLGAALFIAVTLLTTAIFA